MKPENKDLTKGKMAAQVGYKKLAALLDDDGKGTLIRIVKNGAVCEVRERQVLSNGAQTITVKFYFDPT